MGGEILLRKCSQDVGGKKKEGPGGINMDVSNMLSFQIPERNKAEYSLLALWELN